MPFCYNCGAEINVNDRKCGKCSYIVGQVISIHDEGIYTVKRRNNPLIRYISEVFHVVCAVIKEPINNIIAISTLMGNNISFGVLTLLLAINGCIFVWAAKLIETTVKAAQAAMHRPDIAGANSTDLGTFSSLVNFNYGKAFFNGAILFAFIVILQFSLIYLISKFVFKGKIKAYDAWKISISILIPYCIGVILAFTLSYFNGMLSLVSFSLGTIVSIICLYKALEHHLDLSNNKIIFEILLSCGMTFIAISIVVKYKISALTNGFITKELLKSLLAIYTMN